MAINEIKFLRPFGPSIAKVQLPNEIINTLNEYVDKIILDQEKSKKLDFGKYLAGNVKQEILIEESLVRSSGLLNFLGNSVQEWIHASDKKIIKEFKIISTWVIRQFENEYNPIHNHNGHISGVGYLKLPKSFGKPFQTSKEKSVNGNISFIHGARMFNSSSILNVEPKVGDFYIFPNYLMHSVNPFYGEDERRSVSFNATIDDSIYNVYG